MIFPVVMYGCDSWSKKKVEHWRIDAFKLWVWRRLLSILKKISPEYSLEGLLLKLKLQYSGHLMKRADSLEKTLMLGKTEDRRRKGWQRMRWLDGITDSMDVFEWTLGDGDGLACCDSWGRKELDMTEQLNNNNKSVKSWYSVKLSPWSYVVALPGKM